MILGGGGGPAHDPAAMTFYRLPGTGAPETSSPTRSPSSPPPTSTSTQYDLSMFRYVD